MKDGRSGKFFSLSVKRKDGTADRPGNKGKEYASVAEFKAEVKRVYPDAQLDDSDVPF